LNVYEHTLENTSALPTFWVA